MHMQVDRARQRAAEFARAYNREDMDLCDAIARDVTGGLDARGGLRPNQRWDRDEKLSVQQARDFLTDV